ncbi:leucine-rich repeat domain-containing protein [Parabacteroides goldsteinii]|uniref:leucine-rich repeat domain-containing protein n=1 Tax=Parabacteroides goldsteinii TaxID=328812 RepID=UPI00242AEBC8|nr:leucine-rich repeat domain-containing protein [Parabacteroides goldsteinii]
MNRFFTNKTKAASLLRGLLLLSIMMLTSVGTWARGEGSGDPPTVNVTDTAALKSALESETISTINMTESITLTEEEKITVGAGHTLSIAAGKTLTCTVLRGIAFKAGSYFTLTIQGGGKLEINVAGGGTAITGGTLTLENITVDITSGIINPFYLTVGSGATINVDAENQDSPLQISRLTVDNGGTINIKTFKRVGININFTLTINNGGTVKVGNGTGDNRGITISKGASIVLNGGTLEGTGNDKGGNIYLQQNAKVKGMSGKLVDRGENLSENGEVTVGAENAEPSTTSLTEGAYTWDKSTSKFAKPVLNKGWELLENGALTISSQTGMANWKQNGQSSNGKDVKSVTITGDVTEIVGSAFTFCSNLTQVTITATGITSIGASAFQNTKSLTTIEIPASVTTIGNAAFAGSGISTFTVAEGSSSFKADADCKALLTSDGKTLVVFAPKATGSYTIPGGVETIGPYSFETSALTSLVIPSSVKTIGESAFYLSALTSIEIGEAVETIEAMAFFSSALTSIVIPESVKTIGEAAFTLSALTSIVIPKSVETIGDAAFSQSSALTTVTFEGESAPTIGKGIFAFCDNLTSILVPANATGYTGDGASDNWKAWATYIKAGQTQGQTQTDGEYTVPEDGTLIGDGQTTATKVTPEGNATLENVKTQATEIAVGTTSVITLTGAGNALGAITNAGTLTLNADEGTTITVASVDNSGTFIDNTGSVTVVTGDASLDLSADDAMPSDQTATGQVTLTAKPAVAEGADVSYQWQKQENGSWTDVSNPYTRAAVAGSPDFTTNISGTYRCRITVEKGSVSTTLLTQSATATVNSIPDPEPTYYTVTLPSVEGATTDPLAGSYDVESSDNFRFYLTLDADYNQSVPVVTTSRGETITPRTSDGAYIVKYVHSNLVISISGIAKNPPPVANAEIQSGTRIFTRDGSLFITTDRPARAQVIALTGQLIRSLSLPAGTTRVDALAIGVYIVRLDDGMTRKVIIGR